MRVRARLKQQFMNPKVEGWELLPRNNSNSSLLVVGSSRFRVCHNS